MISQEYGQAYAQELSWPGGELGGLSDGWLLGTHPIALVLTTSGRVRDSVRRSPVGCLKSLVIHSLASSSSEMRDGQSWVKKETAESNFGDARLNRRLEAMLEVFEERPGQYFTTKFQD